RPIPMIVLSEKSSENVKFDIFHRLNSGGKGLTDSQIRRGAFPGRFYQLVIECAKTPKFIELCPFKGRADVAGDREELVLRFFVYSNAYCDFTHDVANFLNKYIVSQSNVTDAELESLEHAFNKMLTYVADE